MLTADVSKRTDFSECAPSTIALNDLWVAAERVQDYARASGCNGIVVPANSGVRTWYESSLLSIARGSTGITSSSPGLTLLQLLASSQLRIYVGLQPNMLLTELERTIHEQDVRLVELTRSESTADASKAGPIFGRTAFRRELSTTRCIRLSKMQSVAWSKELSDLCNRCDGFAGILVDCDGNSHLRPLRNASTDAGSILLFGRANQRYRQRGAIAKLDSAAGQRTVSRLGATATPKLLRAGRQGDRCRHGTHADVGIRFGRLNGQRQASDPAIERQDPGPQVPQKYRSERPSPPPLSAASDTGQRVSWQRSR